MRRLREDGNGLGDNFPAKVSPEAASGRILDAPLSLGFKQNRWEILTGAGPQVLLHQGQQMAIRITQGQVHP